MGGVRGDRGAQVLRSIQRKGEELRFGHPEISIHRDPDPVRGSLRPQRGVDQASPTGESCIRPVGRDGVSLDLDHRDRRCDSKVVLRAILPALMPETVRVLSGVLEITVAVEVAELDHPMVGRSNRAPQFLQHRLIAGGSHVGVGDDQEQGRAVDAAVIWESPIR